MAIQPKDIPHLEAEVISVKGECSAGHSKGERLKIGCWDTGGLCGFFYHDIFPSITLMQFGGKYPWSAQEEMVLSCPDRENEVTIRLRRP